LAISKRLLFLTVTFILVMQAVLRASFTSATPSIIRVPADYPTIQAAINAAKPGDTIYVESGIYYELIKVNKSVTIVGERQETTIIDGQQKGPILNITASCVKIQNLTIQNGKYYVGIWIENPPAGTIASVLIINNIFKNNYEGVVLVRSIGSTIQGNKMINNQYGMTIYKSTLTTITNNYIENSIFYGIHMHTSANNNTIRFNTLINNKYGIHIETSSYNNITLNTITSATNKNGYGIRLTTSTRNKISGNTIQFNSMGIVLWENSNGNLIYYNNFLNNTQQQYHYNTALTANTWDTNVCPGAKGNYWSDYTGIDNGSGVGRWGEPRLAGDGVGDTLIPHQGVDYYPLMTPWSPWPVARFTYSPEQPRVGETITFDASASSGDLVSYKWNFGDGSPEVIENDPITMHVYTEAGNYTVTLTVTDRDGLSNSTSKIVPVLPVRVQLDVYTQKEPYSGKSFNQTSDSFAPQELVILYGLVTYNGEPVKDKIVSFNIFDPDGVLVASRSNVTDENGIATVAFRLESCGKFGTYLVVGTTEVLGYMAIDYLRFKVGWIITIMSIETVDSLGNLKSEFAKEEAMYINVYINNIALTPKNITLTIVVYDNKNTPIAIAGLQTTVDPGWADIKSAFTLIIPEWTLIGKGSIYSNVFTDWLWKDGVPYCPEHITYVIITS